MESKGRLYDAQEDRPDAEGDEDEDDIVPRVVASSTNFVKIAPGAGPSGSNGGNMIDLDDLIGGISGSI